MGIIGKYINKVVDGKIKLNPSKIPNLISNNNNQGEIMKTHMNQMILEILENKLEVKNKEYDKLSNNDESKENQDSNSCSNLSTISDEELKYNQINSNNDKNDVEDKEVLNNKIKEAMGSISDYYNSFECFGKKQPSLAAYYYCNLTLDKNEISYLNDITKELVKKIENENENKKEE